jgi:hypothetical protein
VQFFYNSKKVRYYITVPVILEEIPDLTSTYEIAQWVGVNLKRRNFQNSIH